jgi:hypothetical protein
MSIVIKDGSGSGGFEARVDKDNKLYTHATTFSNEHDQSLKGLSYFANTTDTADTLTVTTTGGPMLYIKNTSTTQNLVVSKVLPSTDQAATVLKLVRSPTLGTIGNENTHVPPNLNIGSSKTANATVYTWDEVGNGMTGLSGGTTIHTWILGVGTTALPIDDALIVTPGTSVHWELKAIGSSAECSLGVRFHFEDID